MASARVELSRRAAADLREIQAYIARDDAAAAQRLITRMLRRIATLVQVPRSGRVVPEKRDPRYRELIVAGYRLIYRVEGRRVVLLTVCLGRRMLRLP